MVQSVSYLECVRCSCTGSSYVFVVCTVLEPSTSSHLLKGSVWSKKSFPFFAENMIIRSILNLWWHSEILKLILGVVRGMFTKRLKRTRRLLYTVKYDFFQMTALHSKC